MNARGLKPLTWCGLLQDALERTGDPESYAKTLLDSLVEHEAEMGQGGPLVLRLAGKEAEKSSVPFPGGGVA